MYVSIYVYMFSVDLAEFRRFHSVGRFRLRMNNYKCTKRMRQMREQQIKTISINIFLS